MKTAFRKGVAVLLVLVFGPGPLPAPAGSDDSVAKIKKVVQDDLKEVEYPTNLVQLVTDQSQRDADKNMAVAPGEAVLTRTANTFVQVAKEDRQACLYSNTFVRFDDIDLWLLRNGAVYVVNKRGKLEVVAEALGRVLVGSSVLLRSDGSELIAFVTEGHVVLEAGAHTLSLEPGQAGRIPKDGVPERTSLDPEKQAQLQKQLQATEKAMKGGGGGSGWLIALLGAGAAIGTGVALSHGGGGDHGQGGGTGGGGNGKGGEPGGTQALPDLVPVADPAAPCRFDNRGNLLVTVRNLGRAPAGESTAEIDLQPAQATNAAAKRARKMDRAVAPQARQLRLRVGSLAAGATAEVPVSTGGAAIGSYRLTVNSDGRARESNHANNTVSVACPVPIG